MSSSTADRFPAWVLVLSLLSMAVLGAWLGLSSSQRRLTQTCERLKQGDFIEDAAVLLPMKAYRSQCCSGSPTRCGEQPICHLLPTTAGPLAYNCDDSGSDCAFVWQAGRAQCLLLANPITGMIHKVESSVLAP